jgi:hypothetical protein
VKLRYFNFKKEDEKRERLRGGGAGGDGGVFSNIGNPVRDLPKVWCEVLSVIFNHHWLIHDIVEENDAASSALLFTASFFLIDILLIPFPFFNWLTNGFMKYVRAGLDAADHHPTENLQ